MVCVTSSVFMALQIYPSITCNWYIGCVHIRMYKCKIRTSGVWMSLMWTPSERHFCWCLSMCYHNKSMSPRKNSLLSLTACHWRIGTLVLCNRAHLWMRWRDTVTWLLPFRSPCHWSVIFYCSCVFPHRRLSSLINHCCFLDIQTILFSSCFFGVTLWSVAHLLVYILAQRRILSLHRVLKGLWHRHCMCDRLGRGIST